MTGWKNSNDDIMSPNPPKGVDVAISLGLCRQRAMLFIKHRFGGRLFDEEGAYPPDRVVAMLEICKDTWASAFNVAVFAAAMAVASLSYTHAPVRFGILTVSTSLA